MLVVTQFSYHAFVVCVIYGCFSKATDIAFNAITIELQS